ncbi:hypothetical protein CDL12_03139 [Handroanthus impetiginosus]|uniref:Transcription repressor n=1 Tax=Handroanthus impetiginosus TaxID=429701 RepID=A0A2G9I312_9LAMI|nr:hypothetical protein CDL12_03139 [Handroanthus impetiginosus]
MAKRFKLRICRVIATTLQSCRSKDPSILPEDPVPSFSKLKPHRSSVKHRLCSAIISIGTRGNLPPTPHGGRAPPQEFKWQKEKKWHVVAKIYDHPTPRRKINTSSDDDDDDLSFSLPPAPPPSSAEKKKRSHKRRVSKRTKRRVLRPPPPAAELEIPARLSIFKKLIPCTVDGKVKESFAIVKRSDDPYEDFKNSMMDMILEKQMFDRKDLEQLLQCFLSLNSRNYHGIIVEVFSEIWEAIFSPAGLKPVPVKSHCGRRVSRPASF